MMKIKTILRKCFLWAVASMSILMLSGCFPSFNTNEEVMSYLKKKFPDQQIVLSPEYDTHRSLNENWRTWSFRLSGYPKDTFQVASRIKSLSLLMPKKHREIIDNFGKVVTLRCEREFEQGVLPTFDRSTRSLWRGFPREGFSLKPAEIEISSINDIRRVKHLIEAFENLLRKEKSTEVTIYKLHMRTGINRIVRLKKISDLFFDKIWNRKEKEKEKEEEEKLYYLEYYIYGCMDLQKQCQIFYNNVMVYYQQMATQGNGVNDKNMQAWAEEQLKLKASLPELSPKERDSLRNLLVIADTRVTSVFIDTGQKPYMLVTQSNIDDRPHSSGIFFTYPQMRAFCIASGLRVNGDWDHFTLMGADGRIYEFSITFYKKKKDGVGYKDDTCYYMQEGKQVVMPGFCSPKACISEALIRQVTGRDVRKMIVHEVKE